ncbi:hypothetical protein [Rathayibacter iranicus]|uniref:Peptidase S1 domain-containing protein n=2 Tax=Rathayibacter iranicus TaxID=59737 RepID=A0AAD1EL76_9MICO|nr:hypothetical protein [Rathayibacter iranicus]AZZ54792.1 hypothetical protein C7V51_02015 [Rathayibacter iranicus]MWV31356.1 hypothetical protein [Rathayibacter iranicus NCPPB 2253 = VKM Ac-1602]PPI50384.1 hypothetical protein C5E09_02045 [Rathayibacter iranicus]PPI62711.1 hypothetical protein C5E08_02050 [Rathayibacter iranicus]PPI73784.1 hypothetical protein C5E01_02025 [Rathayibacter iranicus]
MRKAVIACPANRAVGLISVLLVLGAMVGFASPANALNQIRRTTPIVAGTVIASPTKTCTVGAVLVRNTVGAFASSVTAAVRYLVLAKHCAPAIGTTIRLGTRPIGIVTWISAVDDVELVQVPPEITSTQGCHGAHGCFGGDLIVPLASGRVVLGTPGGERAVPMKPAAIPGADERFCTSGGISGVNCRWMVETDRPGNWGDSAGQIAVTTGDRLPQRGDSGGPVVGQQGQLYGIIQRGGFGSYSNLMQYLPIEELFSQLNHEFDIAPL